MAKSNAEIKYAITLDEDQKKVKADIYSSQIVIVSGRAGSGKSLVCANVALDMMFKKHDGISKIYVTRANVETGRSLGYLPGSIDEKFNPYLEAFKENVFKCYVDNATKKDKIEEHFKKKDIDAMPIAFIRGKTIDDILVVEETQNLTPHEISSIVSRLGKTGRIIFNGDFDQCDIRDNSITGEKFQNGLHYLKEMSKAIPEIKWHSLKNNHRSDLVGKILDWEYARKKTNDAQ
jgi:predicted ribonuclease YlaK